MALAADPREDSEDTVAIRQLNAAIHQDERVDASLLPVFLKSRYSLLFVRFNISQWAVLICPARLPPP